MASLGEKVVAMVSSLVTSFAKIFLGSLFLWMIGLVGLLIREIIQDNTFSARKYFSQVGRMLWLAFEMSSYLSVPVAFWLLYGAWQQPRGKILDAVTLLLAGLFLAYLFFSVRLLRRRRREKTVMPPPEEVPSSSPSQLPSRLVRLTKQTNRRAKQD